MYGGYRVVAFTFVGRRGSLQILSEYLQRNRNIVDEWILFWNVRHPDDQEFVIELNKQLNPWTRIVGKQQFSGEAYGQFYDYTQDEDTLYVKLDDDIVWMANDALTNLLDFRVANPRYLLVSANVVNNVRMTFLHQRLDVLPWAPEVCWGAFDPVALTDGHFCEKIHRAFLDDLRKGTQSRWCFSHFVPLLNERFPINAICFFGADFLGMRIPDEDEEFISSAMTRLTGRPCAFVGTSLMAHYSFEPQFSHMNSTDILDQYRQIATSWGQPEIHYMLEAS